MEDNVFTFSATGLDRKPVPLSQFKGKVLLVVNVASKCGFTPQYEGLEKLQRELGPKGFTVLGFPCNQFGAQEPGDENEIRHFCDLNYKVSFPLFSKVEVNGKDSHPLFSYLKKERPGVLGTESIKWNFTKFLVGRDGVPVKRFAPKDAPESLRAEIEKLL